MIELKSEIQEIIVENSMISEPMNCRETKSKKTIVELICPEFNLSFIVLINCLLYLCGSGIWSIWQKNTWRNTMSGTGFVWLLQTRTEMFTNLGTSTSQRMREKRKIKNLDFHYWISMLLLSSPLFCMSAFIGLAPFVGFLAVSTILFNLFRDFEFTFVLNLGTY